MSNPNGIAQVSHSTIHTRRSAAVLLQRRRRRWRRQRPITATRGPGVPAVRPRSMHTHTLHETYFRKSQIVRSLSLSRPLSLSVCVCFWGERAVCGWASAGARLLVCKWGVGSCGARASTFDVLFWLVFAAGVVCLCCPHMRPRRRRSWSLSVIVACACVLSICIDFMIIRISCAVWSALSPSRPTIVCVCVLCSTTCVFGVLAVYVCVMLC